MSIFSRLFGRKNNLTVSSDIKKEDAEAGTLPSWIPKWD